MHRVVYGIAACIKNGPRPSNNSVTLLPLSGSISQSFKNRATVATAPWTARDHQLLPQLHQVTGCACALHNYFAIFVASPGDRWPAMSISKRPREALPPLKTPQHAHAIRPLLPDTAQPPSPICRAM